MILKNRVLLVEKFMYNLFVNTPTKSSSSIPSNIKSDDIAALMYSSGTTGKSKAVVCSHRNLVSMGGLLRHVWNTEGGGDDDVYMCVVPLFHMFGLSMMVCGVLAARSTAVLVKKYSVEEMLSGIERYNVTRLPVAPPVVVQMVRFQNKMNKYNLKSLKEVICSGAPLGNEHIERFCKIYPQINLTQVAEKKVSGFALSLRRRNRPRTRFLIEISKQLWVLESVPGDVNPEESDGEVEKVFQTLQSLPSEIPSRKWLVDYMMELGFFKSLSQWVGNNLMKSGDHETWAFDLQGA
ncbi:hypothetical protein C5167_024664, partial [Papaver somniferum]